METSTNHSSQKESDSNLPRSLKELQSASSFWSPFKAIPIASFYKLHRAPSFTPMADPALAGINGDTLSHTELSTSSGPEKQVPPDGVAFPHSEPSVKSVVDEQVPPNGAALPRGELVVDSIREEQVPLNGIHNKLLEQVIRTPGRQPSPSPIHLSVTGPSHHRMLHEEGPGYVAPKFEGKEQQMEEGSCLLKIALISGLTH